MSTIEIRPIKIMLDTNIPGKKIIPFTKSLLYNPELKNIGGLDEYPNFTMDAIFPKAYLNSLSYENRVKFFFDKNEMLKVFKIYNKELFTLKQFDNALPTIDNIEEAKKKKEAKEKEQEITRLQQVMFSYKKEKSEINDKYITDNEKLKTTIYTQVIEQFEKTFAATTTIKNLKILNEEIIITYTENVSSKENTNEYNNIDDYKKSKTETLTKKKNTLKIALENLYSYYLEKKKVFIRNDITHKPINKKFTYEKKLFKEDIAFLNDNFNAFLKILKNTFLNVAELNNVCNHMFNLEVDLHKNLYKDDREYYKAFFEKRFNTEEEEEEEDEEEEIVKKKSKKTDKKKNISEVSETSSEALRQLKELLEKNPKDKSIQKCIDVYEKEIKIEKSKKEKKQKKQKAKNLRIFRRIIKDKNTMNDFAFYEKLELENQKKLIKELKEINKITRIEKPYRMTLLESTIPVEFKAAAMKKINSLKYMDPGSGDFYKIKNWVDTFMRIPFTNFDSLPLSIEDGVDKCHDFMENAQKILDNAVYGLNDAKMQIMQMLGQLLTNPKAIGTAIAIHGPPGTGKTSLVKEGISKILNRPFAFIALGGATDSSFLEGHGYTYEGSTWGKIVQTLIDSKSMNPVFYFDELDKISDTPRGEEIVGILTHLTDTSQNSQFHDKYFSEINFDLSKCLFIFSYNDESKVNPILKDRMYRIKTKGYSGKEKGCISSNYLLPKIREQVKFNEEDIIIPDDVITHIIETHCNKEDGVRNLKRCLEIIHTKLNLYRLMKPGSNLFEGEMSLKVEFPFKVTKDVVDKLIKKENDGYCAIASMYL